MDEPTTSGPRARGAARTGPTPAWRTYLSILLMQVAVGFGVLAALEGGPAHRTLQLDGNPNAIRLPTALRPQAG